MKPCLVLLTGWAHRTDSFDSLRARLDASFDVHALSPHDPPGRDYAQQLAASLRGLVRPAVVLGWSMGGIVALEAAIGNPRLVRALVLVASTARFCSSPDYPHGADPRRLAAMRRQLARDARPTLESFFALARTPRSDPTDDVRLAGRALEIGPAELGRGLDYLAATDLRERLHTFPQPALLLHGTHDAVIPADASRFLASRLPSCRLVPCEGAGHDLPSSETDFVATQTEAFIGTLAG